MPTLKKDNSHVSKNELKKSKILATDNGRKELEALINEAKIRNREFKKRVYVITDEMLSTTFAV